MSSSPGASGTARPDRCHLPALAAATRQDPGDTGSTRTARGQDVGAPRSVLKADFSVGGRLVGAQGRHQAGVWVTPLAVRREQAQSSGRWRPWGPPDGKTRVATHRSPAPAGLRLYDLWKTELTTLLGVMYGSLCRGSGRPSRDLGLYRAQQARRRLALHPNALQLLRIVLPRALAKLPSLISRHPGLHVGTRRRGSAQVSSLSKVVQLRDTKTLARGFSSRTQTAAPRSAPPLETPHGRLVV